MHRRAVSDVGSLGWVVEDTHSGPVFKANDASDLGRVIIRLLREPDLREPLRLSG